MRSSIGPIRSTDPFSWNVVDRAPMFSGFGFGRERSDNSFFRSDQILFLIFKSFHHTLRFQPPIASLPELLNARPSWAAVRTVFPLKRLSTTIMFVPFVSQWLRDGPAQRRCWGTQACAVRSALTVLKQRE